MNTPTPITPRPSDPTTPGDKPAPTAFGAAALTATIGTGGATAFVWALTTFGTAHGKPIVIDPVSATAVGSVGAAVIAYAVQVVQGVLSAIVNKR